ncbi:Sodium-dependent dicarboxylate transporter SdcS [Candidatus Hepatincola sp. Av]
MQIKYKIIIFTLAILCSIFTLTSQPMFGLNPASWHMFGLIIIMVLFWITEVVPMAVTALIPIAYAPLTGLDTLRNVTSHYADPIIFLFFGGLTMGLAIEKTNLHKRIALTILSKMGNDYRHQLLGFMIASAGISMWISNTATAAMLLPVVLAVIATMPKDDSVASNNFPKALLIGMAYAASIGGIGTIIGTPPLVLLKGFLATQANYNISFLDWLIFGTPLMIVMLIIAYFLLIKIFRLHDGKAVKYNYQLALKELGPISSEQRYVFIIFLFIAFAWIFKDYINLILHLKLTDEIIAIIAFLVFLTVPAPHNKGEPILNWEDMKGMSWDILLLFGGGLSLAALFIKTGFTVWVVSSLNFINHWSLLAIIFLVTLIVKFLTELTSNSPTTAATLPIFYPLALSIHVNPLTIAIPLAVSAALAFMMPIGTPPNAIVFSSGKLKIKDMVKVGFYLNIISIVLISVYVYYVAPLIFK